MRTWMKRNWTKKSQNPDNLVTKERTERHKEPKNARETPQKPAEEIIVIKI